MRRLLGGLALGSALCLVLLAGLVGAQSITGVTGPGGSLSNPVTAAQGGFGANVSALTGIPYDAAGTFSFISCASGLLQGGTPPTCTNAPSISGQLTSTLATGTPPFVIASTTNVPNLNASSLNGATFAAPGPIGGTTPNTATFTSETVAGPVSITNASNDATTGLSFAGGRVQLYQDGSSAVLQSTGAVALVGASGAIVGSGATAPGIGKLNVLTGIQIAGHALNFSDLAGAATNAQTTATSANTASAIVARDASGNFSAGTITAALSGNASTVTTNANLTGPITSTGNATAVAAQTGTGSTFVMNTSPTISNPVIANHANTGVDTTITQNSVAVVTSEDAGATVDTLHLKAGNVGIGKTPGSTTLLDISKSQNTFTSLAITNADTGTAAKAMIQIVSAGNQQLQLASYGSGNTSSRWGVTLGGYSELLGGITGNGMAIGTFGATSLILGTNGAAVLTLTSVGALRPAAFVFANIATVLAANGDLGYCSDCTIANPCAGSGNGAIAKRLNGVNVCN